MNATNIKFFDKFEEFNEKQKVWATLDTHNIIFE